MATAQSIRLYSACKKKKATQNNGRAQRVIMVDNPAAVKVGDVEKNMDSRKVVKPKFTTEFPEAVVREGAVELTLRADEEGAVRTFIDTTNVGDKKRWGSPLVDEDWHAICQAIYGGVEVAEWETTCCKYVQLHTAAKCKKSGEIKKAQTLRSLLKKQKDHEVDVFE